MQTWWRCSSSAWSGIWLLASYSILESELPDLQQKAVDLRDMVSEIVLWGNSDYTSCQAPEPGPEVHTWYILVHTWYILICSYLVVVCTSSYFVVNLYIDSTYSVRTFCQHAHIENIKTAANLINDKDVFMCILCFHAERRL
jgi:hypothetical protein